MKSFVLIAVMFAALMFAQVCAETVIGTASIHAPAVIVSNNTGSITTIILTVYSGDGYVNVTGPQVIGASTQQSAQTAAQYAAKYLRLNFSRYNFTYTILNAGENVSGPSGGTAMTLLAIAALSGQHLLNNFTVTGTISSNGTVGLIGGVYDKSQAAKAAGMRFIIVPSAASDQSEEELYVLVQDAINIPLVQAANVSQAAKFAFGMANPSNAKVNFSLYTNYNVSSLQTAPISCSNQCNASQFNKLSAWTFNYTNTSIAHLGSSSNFSAVAGQLRQLQNEYSALASKGYIYAASDLSFLNYINSYYFNSHSVTEGSGFSKLQGINSYCDSLTPPQITLSNYEYVIGGELRQAWGAFTTNTTLNAYNASVQTTDDVLAAMRSAGTANAWCGAASEMYNIAVSMNGTDVVPSQNLSTIAYERINRAASSGANLYLNTARAAYAVNNYPLAIIDADYDYALTNVSSTNMTTGQLLNASTAISKNSTYGIWATQFSNEAGFYIQEATMHSSNASAAKGYAIQAYQSAMIASQLSSDMALIHNNLVPGVGTQKIGPTVAPTISTAPGLLQATNVLFGIAIIMVILNILLFIVIIGILLPILRMEREAMARMRTRRSRHHRRARR